jgi:Cof subfamily protein (haloacid dehalogenase superfamily)
MQIVFSDLDGTLLTAQKTVHPLCVEALERFQERGGVFVPCTGRPRAILPDYVTDLPGARYAICVNGATVYDLATNEVIMRGDIGPDRVLRIYDAVSKFKITFDVMADGRAFTERERYNDFSSYGFGKEVLAHLQKSRTPFDEPMSERLHMFDNVERLTMYWHNEQERDEIIRVVEEDPTLSWTSSEANNIEVSDADASKGAAVEWLCDHLGIDRGESVAFGDGMNDTTMLQSAGIGVAMKNAQPGVAQYADESTRLTNNEGGVGDWILQHL